MPQPPSHRTNKADDPKTLGAGDTVGSSRENCPVFRPCGLTEACSSYRAGSAHSVASHLVPTRKKRMVGTKWQGGGHVGEQAPGRKECLILSRSHSSVVKLLLSWCEISGSTPRPTRGWGQQTAWLGRYLQHRHKDLGLNRQNLWGTLNL